MTFDLSSLNEKQKEAVTHTKGPLAILSVAGSGKTRTMVAKIEYLLTEQDVLPSRLWACTFTNKAADEMHSRLVKTIGNRADKIRLSTIHSLAYKIWKSGLKAKIPSYKMPKIMANEGRVLIHLYKYVQKMNMINKDAKGYLSDIAKLKLKLVSPNMFKNSIGLQPDDFEVNEYNKCLYHVYVEYETWKKKWDMIDFNDMLVNCYYLLINPLYTDFVLSLQKKCEYLLVDEVQDTNTVSFKILDILSAHHNNITIVGDLRQAIYSFQGSDISNIHNFIEKHKPKIIDLSINYRSTKTIVENANSIISNAKGIIGAKATTPNKSGSPVYYTTSQTQCDEANSVLNIVNTLVSEGCEYRDIAILYRIHSQSRLVEDNFIFENIPYITFAKKSFYERKEIKDMIAYLTLFSDPSNITSATLKRIANKPTRYISNKSFDELEVFSMDENISIWEALGRVHASGLDFRMKQNLDKLYDELSIGVSRCRRGASCSDLCEYVLYELEYEEWAINKTKVRDVDSDVELNFDAILDSMAIFKTPLDYINHIREVKKKENEVKDESGNFVKMLSIHASKGKEFKYVIVLGVCDRIYPFHLSVKEGNEEEERRVMYVAITRPEHKLYLSIINGTMGRFKAVPSRYIQEMNFTYNGGSNV